MYPSVKLDLNRYPLVRALMTAKYGVSRGNPWHLIIDIYDTTKQLKAEEWYDCADFLEGTLALNGYKPTADEYDRFVKEHGGTPPWARLLRARARAFDGRTVHNKFPVFSSPTEYKWARYETALDDTYTLRSPPRKRARTAVEDYGAVAQQWTAMKVLLESLGCWKESAPPSLDLALDKALITPQQHKIYTQLHKAMNDVRH